MEDKYLINLNYDELIFIHNYCCGNKSNRVACSIAEKILAEHKFKSELERMGNKNGK